MFENKRSAGLLIHSFQTILQNIGSRHPKDYQEIKWKVDTQPQNPCSILEGWSSEYSVCMKGELPRAMAGHFIVIMSQRLLRATLKLYKFEKEHRTNKLTSYIAPCDGDSGSGHWVTVFNDKSAISQNEKDDNTRRALVAVMIKTVDASFKLPNGQSVKVICGGVVRGGGKKRAYGPFAIRTTHTEILKFIKKWAIDCKDDNEGYCAVI